MINNNNNEPDLIVSENFIKLTKSDPIKIHKKIYKSKHNQEEAIYLDAIKRDPMYCPNGASFIDKLIKDINEKKDGWKDKIKEHKELIDKMVNHGILQYQRKPFTQKKDSLSIYLLLSQSCNLGCIYCLNGEDTYCKSSNLNMDENTAFTAIRRFAQEMNPNGRMEIVFFGGEPLLNWDLAKKIMEHVTTVIQKEFPGLRFHFHLTSNLYKIPPDLVEYGRRYKMTFLCEIIGPPEIHDQLRPNRGGNPSCEQITKNIKYLAGEGFRINLRATITSHNHDKIYEISKYHKEIGGSGTAFVLLNPVNSDEMIMPKEWLPDVDKYLAGLQQILSNKLWNINEIFPLNEYKNRIGKPGRNTLNCGAPHCGTPTIDVNGNVYPCIYWVGMSKFLLGNIFDKGELKNISICNDLQNKLNVENREDCKECKWKYICGGGCAVNYIPAIYRFGVMDNIDPDILDYMLKFTCKLTAGCMSICLWDIVNKNTSVV